jgi:probable HAF family extracellular repeat protein
MRSIIFPSGTVLRSIIISITVTCVLNGAQAQVPQYVVYDLGTLGAGNSEAFSINDSGQITGSSNHTGGPDRHAFLYSGGPLIDLGTLGGTASTGYGINNLSDVTGHSSINPSDADTFLYSGGVMTNIGTPLGNSVGYSINNSGQVAGFRTSGGSSVYHAYIRSNGVNSDLPTLGTTNYSFATAINEGGEATGYSAFVDTDHNSTHAFLYSSSTTLDLGTLGGLSSEGWAINASGQVAGDSQLAGNLVRHAFLGSTSGLLDLGTLGGEHSFGKGINDFGQVVGSSQLPSTTNYHPFLYSDGAMYDLNDLTLNLEASGMGVLYYASDINNFSFR